jgi:hypothetical protein
VSRLSTDICAGQPRSAEPADRQILRSASHRPGVVSRRQIRPLRAEWRRWWNGHPDRIAIYCDADLGPGEVVRKNACSRATDGRLAVGGGRPACGVRPVRPEHFRHDGRAISGHDGVERLNVVIVGPSLCAPGRSARATWGPPQPNRTVASDDNQRRRFRNSGVSNLSGINQRSGESRDTGGVTASIPVSPTHEPPRFWGVQSFPGLSRAILGPRKRWSRWLL